MTDLHQPIPASGKTNKRTPNGKSAAKAIAKTNPPKLNLKSKPASPTKNPASEKLLKLLRAKGGATLATLVKETNWKPHTIRAAISKLRSEGFTISLSHNAKDQAFYRITKQPKH